MGGPVITWLARLGAPLGMGVGLAWGGVWTMLAGGALGAVLGCMLALARLTAREAHWEHAREVSAPEVVRRMSERAGLGAPRVFVINGTHIYTTSWRHRAPALFIGECWINERGLDPAAEGAVAHELAHVKRRDVLRSHVIKTLALYLVSLSLISPVGALLPRLFTDLSIAELGMVVTFPLWSWLAATQVSAQLRKLELRADALAATWCGREVLADSLRLLAANRPVLMFSPHPPLAERLRALRSASL